MQRRIQRFRVGKVGMKAVLARGQQAVARGDLQFAERRKRARQFEADLAVRAKEEDLHCLVASLVRLSPICSSSSAITCSYISTKCGSA